MIRSFADPETEKIWNGERSSERPSVIQDRALSKLKLLNRARTLDDLQPPARAERRSSRATFNFHQHAMAYMLCLERRTRA
jgi:plasmid maintenance system killer protein